MTRTIDKGSRATLVSHMAQAALDGGDTRLAQRKFLEAGEILEREGTEAAESADRALAYFLAATQYYKGGHYARARALAERVKATDLPGDTRQLMPRFLKDVADRSSPDYKTRTELSIDGLAGAGDYSGLLGLLAANPYVLHPGALALTRGVCCENLGDYKAAVLFFSDAARHAPGWPDVLARISEVPDQLRSTGEIAKAWEYVNAQLEIFPNPVSKAFASVLLNHDAAHTEGAEERERLWREQDRLFREAREEFARLSDAERTDPRIKEELQAAYGALVLSLRARGRVAESLQTCEEALAAAPELPQPWNLVGIVNNEDPAKAVPAFKKAIELGEQSYFPYLYIAHHAIRSGDFDEARRMSREALEHGAGKSRKLRSFLLQWQAISITLTAGPRDEADRLYREAIDADPESEYARANYQHFLDKAGRSGAWSVPQVRFLSALSSPEWDSRAANRDRPRGCLTKELAGVSG